MKQVQVSVVGLRDLYESLPADVLEWDKQQNHRPEHAYVEAQVDQGGLLAGTYVGGTLHQPISVYDELVKVYARISDYLFRDAQRDEVVEPQIYLSRFSNYGNQSVAGWSITDLHKPQKNEHGQNTSQWVFAGGLLFDRLNFEEWKVKADRSCFSIHT